MDLTTVVRCRGMRAILTAKFLRIMKLTTVFMLAAFLHVSAKGVSQKVNLNVSNARLEQVFNSLQAQSGYSFFYDYNLLKDAKPVTISLKDVLLTEALETVLKVQRLGFSIEANTIIISRRTEPVLPDEPRELPPPIKITGTVTDENGNALAGATVTIKETKASTRTDGNGRFEIEADPGNTLVITFVEFEKVELKIGSQTNLSIKLKAATTALGDITIKTNYYQTTKDRYTGNISKVTAEDIERQPLTTPLMALQGRVPGFDITPSTGGPGAAPKDGQAQIRGLNSLSVIGRFPLYVVDGIPIDATPIKSANTNFYTDGIDPMSTINPSSIESIEVLKDAVATSIYGSRGANGVILITTKKGKNTGKTVGEANIYMGIGKIPNKMKLLNTEQYLDMRKEAYSNDGRVIPTVPTSGAYDLTVWDNKHYTDWQTVLIGGTSNILDIQSGFSGGNANTTFRMGGEFYQETDIYPGNFGSTRVNGNFNLNHKSSNQRFTTTIGINYGYSNTKLFNSSTFLSSALTLPPNAPKLRNDDGSLNWELIPSGTSLINTWSNPLAQLLNTSETMMGMLNANSTITFDISKGFKFSTSFGYSETNSNEGTKNPIAAFSPTVASFLTGSAKFSISQRKTWILEPKIFFDRKYGKNNINAVFGGTWQGANTFSSAISGSGYTNDAFLNSITSAPNKSFSNNSLQYRYIALYSRIGYDYDGKYLLDLSGRRDGSSRFGPGNQFGSFAAIGAGWIFSREKMIQSGVKFISFGKLRVSYGISGNDGIPDYQYLNTYTNYPSSVLAYQNIPGIYPDLLFNPDLAWEKTGKFESSIQLRLFDDRISLEATYYKNRSSNQLLGYSLPATTGFDFISDNLNAVIENKGWEIMLGLALITKKIFVWDISANLSMPKNKLVKFDNLSSSSYSNTYKIGEPLSLLNYYLWKGINPQTGLNEFQDINGDGRISSDDRTLLINYERKFSGGINNQIKYKHFDLSFLLQFSDLIINNGSGVVFPSAYPGIQANQPTYVIDRWQKPGDITRIGKFSTITPSGFNNTSLSNLQLRHTNFVRMKTLSVAYHLGEQINSRFDFSDCLFYLQGQNLFCFKKYLGFDPETGSSLPPLRIVTIGLQIKF